MVDWGLAMKGGKKNPLNRRILREIRDEWVRYLLIALFLILTVGFVSGMYVANDSMLTSADEGVEEYSREDGHFILGAEAGSTLLDDIANFDSSNNKADGTVVYADFFKNCTEDNNGDGTDDGDIRIYEKNDNIDKASVLEGRLPETENEIAIDRMHADNVGLGVGDSISAGGTEYQIVGLISYVNYYSLHEKTSDFMFDALKFDVAMVTSDGFVRLDEPVQYNYAWKYGEEPSSDSEAKDLSQDFLDNLNTCAAENGINMLDYVPAYANPAIRFATDDMGADKAIGGVLLNVLVVIIAFIFLITTSSTIEKESRVIGTLLASGYTKRELVFHYMAINMIVTIVSLVIGIILGYTVLEDSVVSMYYNSYSLPTYHTVWSSEALVKTMLIPLIIVFFVNLIGISWKMNHSPLQFLRHNLKNSHRQHAIKLPDWKFFRRFRVRVMLQNLPNYGVLFVGILFVMVLLALAVGLPETLDQYKANASDLMIAPYQYMLTTDDIPQEIQTQAEDDNAEEFSVLTLERPDSKHVENVTVYGLQDDSAYVEINGLGSLEDNHVYISADYAEKYRVAPGDEITLKDKYSSDSYTFTVDGTYGEASGIDVFMSQKTFGDVFKDNSNRLSGFFSDTELDIPSSLVASTITEADITKMCDQLDHSMGGYMRYFQVLCILLSAALIFLLTKVIIDKNERPISMTKIFGYTDREISSLYLIPTTVCVVISAVICAFIGTGITDMLWRQMMLEFSGWFTFAINSTEIIEIILSVLVGYAIVLFLDFGRIKHIKMDQALKDVE